MKEIEIRFNDGIILIAETQNNVMNGMKVFNDLSEYKKLIVIINQNLTQTKTNQYTKIK